MRYIKPLCQRVDLCEENGGDGSGTNDDNGAAHRAGSALEGSDGRAGWLGARETDVMLAMCLRDTTANWPGDGTYPVPEAAPETGEPEA